MAAGVDEAGAQTIRGRVVDAESQQPILGATVSLLDSEGRQVRRSTTTQEAGIFSLEAPLPGRYRLRAHRLGFAEVTSPPVDIRDREELEVELHLSMEAILLAPLTVVSERRALVLDDRLLSRGYYERLSMYQHLGAHFLEWDEIQRRDFWSLVGVVRTLPGIRVNSAGGRRTVIANRRGAPLSVCIDGHFAGRLTADGLTLDEMAVPSNVIAIEVYPGVVGSGRFRCNLLIWTGVPPMGRDR